MVYNWKAEASVAFMGNLRGSKDDFMAEYGRMIESVTGEIVCISDFFLGVGEVRKVGSIMPWFCLTQTQIQVNISNILCTIAGCPATEQEAEAEREEHDTATEALRKRLRELETGAAQRAAEARAGGAAQDETFHGLVQQEKRDQEELARLLDKLEGMGKAQD